MGCDRPKAAHLCIHGPCGDDVLASHGRRFARGTGDRPRSWRLNFPSVALVSSIWLDRYHLPSRGRSANLIPCVPPALGNKQMPIDVEKLSTTQIEILIENHRTKKATGAPLYADALRELEKRKGKGLDFDKSLSIIWQAAIEGRFLSYKELADASGADWTKVHYEIGRHLWRLVETLIKRNCRCWSPLSLTSRTLIRDEWSRIP
jgi:hypothetical protein